MSEGNAQVDNQNRTEIDRVKAIIRQKLDCAKPGRNGGLLNASRSPATTADRALQDIIDDLQTELDQVTGEEANA